MIKAQTWLDEKYPKEQRKEITSLNISKHKLEGSLDLTDFTNLKKLKLNHCLTNFKLSGGSEVEVEIITHHNEGQSDILSAKDKKNEVYSREYWEAIEKNDAGSIKKLIEERRVNVNDYDEYGNTALHYASQNGYLQVVDILLENGAEVNAEGRNKLTPLHMSLINNHKGITEKFLGRKANPKARDNSNNTPLHFAAEANNLEMLKLLVENGGDINAKNKYDWSVLHSAASGITNKREKKDWEIITWLLENGADYSAVAKNGFTIEDVFEQEDWSYADHYRRIIDNFSTISHQETK